MNIEERLTRIEAHLFGKAEHPKTKERTFESFYVDCTKEQYPEVKRILEAQGYKLFGDEWMDGEDCVKTTGDGYYATYAMRYDSGGGYDYPTYTIPQLREKFGVEQPTAQPVYEAGFVFYGNDSELMLPDGTDLYLRIGRNHWVKETEDDAKPQPHTLTPVSQHTVGKFYALAGIDGEHLSDWRSYALCVKNEDVPYFVRPTSEYGIVVVESNTLVHVSRLEVTPV